MASNNVVVVWEYESRGNNWLPYPSSVSTHLERAHGKRLTRVLLSDADPNLDAIYVNLRTMQQCNENLEVRADMRVRRMFYKPTSPAGKGTKWEWCGASMDWHSYNMEVQCVIEEAWCRGVETTDLSKTMNLPYTINFCNLTQTRQPNGPTRNIRRIQQAPYPLVKMPPKLKTPELKSTSPITYRKPMPTPDIPALPPKPNLNVGKKVSPPLAVASTSKRGGHKPIKPTKQVQEQPSTANLARQILNNLNIFSHKAVAVASSSSNGLSVGGEERNSHRENGQHQSRSRQRPGSSRDLDSNKSSRRPSVDTISTYLSQESKGSGGRRSNTLGSVSDLLDCSIGSDEVFSSMTSQQSLGSSQAQQAAQQQAAGSIVGVDPASETISKFVRVCDPPDYPPYPCPMCLMELQVSSQNPTVSLSRCHHLMHLNCLNQTLIQQKERDPQKKMYIECPVCMTVYGEKIGFQPPGSMSWLIMPKSLPGHEGHNTIQIIYNIPSGIQGPDHPHPGRAFFAVGFPRTCYLPDVPLGRKILRYLKIAFDRSLLFGIGRSATTGVEDVVVWTPVFEHKTQFTMYPDPGYLQRCATMLLHLGVTD